MRERGVGVRETATSFLYRLAAEGILQRRVTESPLAPVPRPHSPKASERTRGCHSPPDGGPNSFSRYRAPNRVKVTVRLSSCALILGPYQPRTRAIFFLKGLPSFHVNFKCGSRTIMKLSEQAKKVVAREASVRPYQARPRLRMQNHFWCEACDTRSFRLSPISPIMIAAPLSALGARK